MNKNAKNHTPDALSILRSIISHLDSRRKKQLTLVLILSIFASIAESISIAMLIPFISFFINPELYLFNEFLEKIFSFFNLRNNKEILALISFSFTLIVLLSGLIKIQYIKLSNLAAENISSDFRIKIFNFLINQDYNYYQNHGSNELMSNLSQKTNNLMTFIFSALNIINSIIIFTGIIAILIFNEPFYTLILITIISFIFFIIFKIKSNSIIQKGKKINFNQNFMIDIFENSVGYLPEIIIYNLKNFFSSILRKASKITAHSTAEIRTIGMLPRVYLETFVIILAVGFIYFSGFTERTIANNISYLAIMAFGAQKCLPLINGTYLLSVNFRAYTPTVMSFLNLLKEEKKEIVKDIFYEELNFNKHIKVEKISYQYAPNLPNVLSNVSLEIIKGQKIAIKGETGSGKSTLTNIISGLLKPINGRILIDGIEIKDRNKKNWQKNISIVPQTIFLNNSSIAENIAIAENLNEINFTNVKKCAELAQVADFIESLSNKYKEEVGERGVRLSGGQRQRIGIARALYRNSSLIIMDEPTNALDSDTEDLVINSIMNLKKDITVIMISHSNNSLKYFDKVIDLDKLK